MAGLRLLVLATALVNSGGIGVPFRSTSFHFNDSAEVPLNSEVYLHCGYYTLTSTSGAFAMRISFVSVENLTQAQLAEVDSRSFLFPQELKWAHEDMGTVLNETSFNPPANESESVIISLKFNMTNNKAGSYICQIYLTNPSRISTGDWTLTKWMYLKVRSSPTHTEVWVLLGLVVVHLIVICCFSFWPRRVIFRRILIEKSPLYATPNKQTDYEPPKITIVDEKPPFKVHVRNAIQFRRFKGFSNLGEIISSGLNALVSHIND
nr:hypothetical protein HmN_000011200 [Hymenolepis microstoma]